MDQQGHRVSLAFVRVFGALGFPRPPICRLRGGHRLRGSAKDRATAHLNIVNSHPMAAGMGDREQIEPFPAGLDESSPIFVRLPASGSHRLAAGPTSPLDLGGSLVLLRNRAVGHDFFIGALSKPLG